MNQNDGIFAFSGVQLKYDDKRCNAQQRDMVKTAALDAFTLATYASKAPTSAKQIAV